MTWVQGKFPVQVQLSTLHAQKQEIFLFLFPGWVSKTLFFGLPIIYESPSYYTVSDYTAVLLKQCLVELPGYEVELHPAVLLVL